MYKKGHSSFVENQGFSSYVNLIVQYFPTLSKVLKNKNFCDFCG